MKSLVILAIFVALLAVPTGAQVLQLDAGSSSLYNGSGATGTLFLPDSTITSGISYGAGHLEIAASDTFTWHGNLVTVGDKQLGFSSPGVGIGLSTIGVSFEHKFGPDSSVAGFVGAAGFGYVTPFAQAVRFQDMRPAAGLFFKRKWRGAKLYSLEIQNGNKWTAAQGVDYQWRQNFRVTGSGGILNGQPYISGAITWHPSVDWNIYASHQDFFEPFHAIGDSIGASFSDGRWNALASVNYSNSQGKTVQGDMLGGGVRFGFLQVTSAWYKTGNRTLTAENITESFPTFHHLTVTENISQSSGQNSYSFGGGFVWANRLSVSLNHSIVFLLNGEGFQQVTGVSVGVRIRDATLNFQTVTTPLGQKLYSVYGSDYLQLGAWTPGSTVHTPSSGKFEYVGRVVDEKGEPVEGAAVQIGRVIAYSNSQGIFSIHGKKDVPQPIAVLPAIFAAPGNWIVVSIPDTISPTASVSIVVRRKL